LLPVLLWRVTLGLLGGLVMTTIDAHGDVWVEIANASPISRELTKWDQVGGAEECEIICQLLRFVTT